MDWDYILSLQTDDITESEKEDLYNTITWFDTREEEMDMEKSQSLLRISQEILKYKGEQIETLLHKLDELATQQGEEDARRLESDTDGRSSKSRKSSSIEFENLEQKYLELRAKYKKQVKVNEKNTMEIKKLKATINDLEQERNHLINELQLINQDDNRSDVSESVKEQHKELMETLRSKNRQISDILQDIEEVEKENLVLREKLANVRDELSVATKELVSLTDSLKASKIQLEESRETITKLTVQNESLHEEIQTILDEKDKIKEEMQEFTKEINIRVDEWKRILNEKEAIIEELKTEKQHSLHSSLSDVFVDSMPQISVLNKALSERENQLVDIKTQLQIAIKEMENSTCIINELKNEKESNEKKINDLNALIKEHKKLLKVAHERCRELQENVDYLEKVTGDKDSDLKDLLDKLKEDGQVELVENLDLIQKLKSENRMQEKQIMNLVKTANRLQDTCDQYDKENEILRDKLNIPIDEKIIVDIPPKRKQLNKKMHIQTKKIAKFEEENLRLKFEMQKKNRVISSLSTQLIDMGVKPNVDETKLEKSSNFDKETIKNLAEENEALRKGMHEILENFNTRKGSTLKELKCDTLEKLLRALDVKHISGWYHPAMRLQAELHNLQGVNSELREQLRLTRSQFESLEDKGKNVEPKTAKDKTWYTEDLLKKCDVENINELRNELANILAEIKSSSEIEEYETTLQTYKENLEIICQQVEILYKQYIDEKCAAENSCQQLEAKIIELEQVNEINIEKLKLISEDLLADSVILKSLELTENNVILKRKCVHYENEMNKLYKESTELKNDLSEAEKVCTKKINELRRKNQLFITEIQILNNKLESSIDSVRFTELNNNFINTTIKYRNLLNEFNELKEYREFEIKMLGETQNILNEDKSELKNIIANLLEKLHNYENIDGTTSENINTLTKKLAEAEVNEITERQRANHINNLYELVKEQLEKSEERFKQYENYNKEILQKNLQLQERLKITESNLCNFVHVDNYKSVQNEYNNLLKEKTELDLLLNENREQLKIVTENSDKIKIWNTLKEQELLNLKHEIVDLQAVSDEKMQIAQLSNDLNYIRLKEVENKQTIDDLRQKLQICKEESESVSADLEKSLKKGKQREEQLKQKISLMQNLLDAHVEQYLGCIPLICEEKFVENRRKIIHEKHEAFLNLYNAQNRNHESKVLKQQQEKEIQTLKKALELIFNNDKEAISKIFNDYEENKMLHFNEIKYRRQSELREKQLEYIMEKVKFQDEQLIKLEEEILMLHKTYNFNYVDNNYLTKTRSNTETVPTSPLIKLTKSIETQTIDLNEIKDDTDDSKSNNNLTILLNANNELVAKDQSIQQLKSKITELEINLSLFGKQLGDKQSQIMFYERHILELQNKKDDNNSQGKNEEIENLKANIKTMQDSLKQKDDEMLKYQSLLKEDRDKHSLAASLMREELKTLERALNETKQNSLDLQQSSTNEAYTGKAALEQYFAQVHCLEKELTGLRTKYSSLESQLQASRKESVRWRTLANDRLISMEKLGKDLEELHQIEILSYKNESEKWRDEVNNLKQLICKYRTDKGHESEYNKIIKEKDDRIHELTVMLRQAKTETRKLFDKNDTESTTKLTELEAIKEQLLKEHEVLKKRFDQLLNKEKNAREEIRELKLQLIKKPALSDRSSRSDKLYKEQLQKKISLLESEIAELKENLSTQIAINESHKVKISEDFDKWNKQKHLQQHLEKIKNKLKTKEISFEKLQQTCCNYKGLIERLERDKYNLESKVKQLKTANTSNVTSELNLLKIKNEKLLTENEALFSKLEMQQHHSGSLGAAMLQEKLEAQERKIAILEVSSKGSTEIRAEMERLQTTIANFQKSNLCLEAENLELKLDLEKTSKEIPHLREQIQHLENYVEILKSEKSNIESPAISTANMETKKAAELERTVFILKRVVEKLQAENKRLAGTKKAYLETGSTDKLRRDYYRLKEEHYQCIQKVSHLEQELNTANNTVKSLQSKSFPDNTTLLSNELESVKEHLKQKSQLLNKVKMLLHRAASREKDLLHQISQLKLQIDECHNDSARTA